MPPRMPHTGSDTAHLLSLMADGRHASCAVALEDSEISTLSYARLTELLSTICGVHHIPERLSARGYSALEFNLKMTRSEIGSTLKSEWLGATLQ